MCGKIFNMSRKLSLTVVILIFTLNTINSAFANDHEHHKDSINKQSSSVKHTIEELLTTVYPYKDPRTDHQVDMDPCKSGKVFYYFNILSMY